MRVLITGASGGIGRAVAGRLAGPEVELHLHGRNRGALAAAAMAASRRGAVVREHLADLADAGEVEALGYAVAAAGPLDALVNNAGLTVVKDLAQITVSEWQDSLAVNVTAPFLLCRALTPAMAAGATVVNVLSIAARRGFPGWAAYCAAKFALAGLTESLREELRPRGIRVVAVFPAATDTPLWNGVAGDWPRERMLAPEQVAEAIAFAISRPPGVLVDELGVGHVSGAL
jgi:NAD(P)-dependent dehydrogenase (short-subunit alcohol dehydrogenase family)